MAERGKKSEKYFQKHPKAKKQICLEAENWTDVQDHSERISAKHTVASDHRSMDVLNPASALYLDIKQFLSFDLPQRDLASVLGLKPYRKSPSYGFIK